MFFLIAMISLLKTVLLKFTLCLIISQHEKPGTPGPKCATPSSSGNVTPGPSSGAGPGPRPKLPLGKSDGINVDPLMSIVIEFALFGEYN